MKSDIEISYNANLENILNIAKKINIDESFVEQYGKYKAKIDLGIFKNLKHKKNGSLILITSINPTPYGEGKTTMSIGINDGLRSLGENSIAVLREPSLGPVFGIKGGATGGGYSQIVPMEDINLHFTGDIHAITSANNLLCAQIDNHIFQGNELEIEQVVFKRCIDINDRALREIEIGLSGKEKNVRKDGFVISVASEIMAILCLAEDLEDLKNKISNILIGYNKQKKPIYVKDLHCEDAMTILLKDAIKPNLVQSLENNPVIVHGGPFANIAHGCNSVVATKLGLKLSDYVITEAGFGADLGAEKFFDIKCRKSGLSPKLVVINLTIRALKHNGGCAKEDLNNLNLEYLEKGIKNLDVHIENMKKFCNNVIVCINHFLFDKDEELNYVINYLKEKNIEVEICKSFEKGGNGARNLAEKIIKLCKNNPKTNFIYKEKDKIKNKIDILAKEIYRASAVEYKEEALGQIKQIEKIKKDKLPICIAKTQYSISDDPKKIGHPKNFKMTVKEVRLSSGAGFIVVIMGNIMTMPGLSKKPSLINMGINKEGKIKGLF